jgi:2,3-bisphosphoglycerate-independent phosphoglycerate mutase
VNVILTDPIFSEEHRLQAAAIAATAMEKGLSLQAATSEAERILYEKLYSASKRHVRG